MTAITKQLATCKAMDWSRLFWAIPNTLLLTAAIVFFMHVHASPPSNTCCYNGYFDVEHGGCCDSNNFQTRVVNGQKTSVCSTMPGEKLHAVTTLAFNSAYAIAVLLIIYGCTPWRLMYRVHCKMTPQNEEELFSKLPIFAQIWVVVIRVGGVAVFVLQIISLVCVFHALRVQCHDVGSVGHDDTAFQLMVHHMPATFWLHVGFLIPISGVIMGVLGCVLVVAAFALVGLLVVLALCLIGGAMLGLWGGVYGTFGNPELIPLPENPGTTNPTDKPNSDIESHV